jgi:hypothetical protein
MSEISNIPPSPSQPRTALREPQPLAGGAQLGQVEEEAGVDDANTPAAFQRAANSILGRPYNDRSNPTFGRGQHAGFIQAQRHALSQYSPQINQNQIEDPFEGSVHSFDNNVNAREFGARFLHPHVADGVGPPAGGTFPLLDRTWNSFSSSAQYPANATNLTRVDYMQVSHLQEAVRQNESASYYLEAGAAACPPESEAAAFLDQARQHLAGTDNIVKIALDVFAALWEHGRAAPAVLDLQNQQSRTYNPTPGRYTVAAQTTELFIQKKLFTNACNNIAPRAATNQPPRSRNGAAGGAAKGGHRSANAPASTPANNRTANRPSRQTGGASAALHHPPAGRGGGPAASDSV